MKTSASTQSPRLVFFVLIGALLMGVLVLVALFYCRSHEARALKDAQESLVSIASLKTDQISNWIQERKGDAGLFFGNPSFSDRAKVFLENSQDAEAQKCFRVWLKAVQKNHSDYDRVFFFDVLGNLSIQGSEVAQPQPSLRKDSHLWQAATEALRTGKISFLDLHRDVVHDDIRLAFVVPIFDTSAGENTAALGCVVLQVDPNKYLYPLVMRWPTPSPSSETLLVRRDGDDMLFLNDLKFYANAALNFRLPLKGSDVPAAHGMRGEFGLFTNLKDYRGVDVLADARPVPGTPWIMVTRLDKAEACSQLWTDTWTVLYTLGSALVTVWLALGWVYYWQKAQAKVSQIRTEAEDVLRESEQKFRALFENTKDAIFLMTEQSFIDCNSTTVEMFGLSHKGEIIGTHPSEYSPPFQFSGQDSMSAAREKITEAMAKGHARFEWMHRRKDGEAFPAEVLLNVIEHEGKKILQATVRDITERKQAEEALRKNQESLKEAARQKDNFLAMLGHELRNPLAPIRNAAQILKMIGLPNPSAEKAREMVERQANHLSRIVDDLLDVSRITRGKVVLHSERMDLVKLVRDCVEDFRSEIEPRGMTLTLDIPSESASLWIKGDPTRLAQVLLNLLVNAQKFSDSGGTITVSLLVNPQTRQAELSVKDTGMGVNPEVMEHLFEPFVQAEMDLARKRGGLGLGLALSKGLVELHGGTIRVESKGSRQGTHVTVCLPTLNESVGAPKSAQTDRSVSTTDLPAESTSNRPTRVLIIEDNQDAAECLQLLLELFGYQVKIAHDGSSGLDKARSFSPDIILCDIGLPGGMDGYEVARTIRQDATRKDVYLIAMTGYGQDEDKRHAFDAGFNEHITKPADPVVLEKMLKAIPV